MILLPIVDRELRVTARRAGTYRNRLWAAFGAIILAVWRAFQLSWEGAPPAVQGRQIFFTLSVLALIYCLIIGARVTSDCISSEKRDGTLGLLFLTDLKGFDVVLGKFVASSLNSFYGLMAVLPLLGMPLLLGGVPGVVFAKMILVLLNTLFFSLSAGLCVSALSRNDRRAMFGTLFVVLAPALLPYCFLFFVTVVLEWIHSTADLAFYMRVLVPNPLYPFLVLMPWAGLPLPPIPPQTFWISTGLVHAASWAMLLTAALVVPSVWRDRAKARPTRFVTPAELWQQWTLGRPEERLARRRELLPINPYLWLVSRDRLKPGYAWIYLSSMIAIWYWGYWQHHEVMFDFYPLAPTLLLVHGVLKLWIATEVSYRLVEDQRNGALELLLSTPLTFEEMQAGQARALLRQFGKPLLILSLVELVVFRSSYSLLVILSVLLMLLADIVTLLHLGMYLSLKARNINEVVMKSTLLVLGLPWAACILFWPIWRSLWQHLAGPAWEPSLQHRVLLWLAIGLTNNILVLAFISRPQTVRALRLKVALGAQGLREFLRRSISAFSAPRSGLTGGG